MASKRTGASVISGKSQATEYDPLSVLDEAASAEPLDEREQEQVVRAMVESNAKSNRIYRGLMLLILGMTIFLYVTPIPDYVMGTHAENHLKLFFSASHGTHEDLTYLPAAPFYLLFFSLEVLLLLAAGYDTAERMGLVTLAGHAFPSQPHLFGTAPGWLVPALTDIRLNTAYLNGRTDKEGKAVAPKPIHPRLLYLGFLLVASLPLPLMTFGAGNFTNAAWWALTTLILGMLLLVESWMIQSEQDAIGLGGMKYAYKGA